LGFLLCITETRVRFATAYPLSIPFIGIFALHRL